MEKKEKQYLIKGFTWSFGDNLLSIAERWINEQKGYVLDDINYTYGKGSHLERINVVMSKPKLTTK